MPPVLGQANISTTSTGLNQGGLPARSRRTLESRAFELVRYASALKSALTELLQINDQVTVSKTTDDVDRLELTKVFEHFNSHEPAEQKVSVLRSGSEIIARWNDSLTLRERQLQDAHPEFALNKQARAEGQAFIHALLSRQSLSTRQEISDPISEKPGDSAALRQRSRLLEERCEFTKWQSALDQQQRELGTTLLKAIMGCMTELLRELQSDMRLRQDFELGLIREYLLPALTALQTRGAISGTAKGDYLKAVQARLREGRHIPWDASAEEQQRIRTREDLISRIEQSIRQEGGTLKTVDDLFDSGGAKTLATQKQLLASLVTEFCQAITRELKETIDRSTLTPTTRQTLLCRLSDSFFDYQPAPQPIDLGQWTSDALKNKLWPLLQLMPIARRNEFLIELLGNTVAEDLYRHLTSQVYQLFLRAHDDRDLRVALGVDIFRVQDPATIPILTLNFWAEGGFTADGRYLRWDVELRDTEACQFARKLKTEVLERIEQLNLPGLMELIAVLRASTASPAAFQEIRRASTGQLRETLDLMSNDPDTRDFRKRTIVDREYRQFIVAFNAAVENEGACLKVAELRNNGGRVTPVDPQLLADFNERVERVCQAEQLPADKIKKIVFDPHISSGMVENPVHYFMQDQLFRLGFQLIQQGSDLERGFAARCLAICERIPAESQAQVAHLFAESKLDGLVVKLLGQFIERSRSFPHDPSGLLQIVRGFANLPPPKQELVTKKAGAICTSLLAHPMKAEDYPILSAITGLAAPALQHVNEFLVALKEQAPWFSWSRISFKQFDLYLRLSQITGALDTIREFTPYGYRFDAEHVDVFPEFVGRRAEIKDALIAIAQTLDHADYRLISRYSYDSPSREPLLRFTVPNPYSLPFEDRTNPFDILNKVYQREGGISIEYVNGLIAAQRYSFRAKPPPELTRQQVDSLVGAITELVKETNPPDGRLKAWRNVLGSAACVQFLICHPEAVGELNQLPEACPNLPTLLGPGGPLSSNIGEIVNDIFRGDHPLQRAMAVDTIFNRRLPLWEQLMLYTQTRLASQLALSDSRYPVHMLRQHKISELIARKGAALLFQPSATLDARGAIAFQDLSERGKGMVLRDCLKESISLSQAEGVRRRACLRNRTMETPALTLPLGCYIHGAAIERLPSLLRNGNLSGECIGESCKVDSFPFHVDFSRVTEADLDGGKKSVAEIIQGSISSAPAYGGSGDLGAAGQIFLLYDRNVAEWNNHVDFTTADPRHALVLGAMPSTEATGIVLRYHEQTLPLARQFTAENGFYIPIYSFDGKLLFTSADYDALRTSRNLDVPVGATWNWSMRIGEQLGSNPGGTYLTGGKQGPERHYVKIMDPDRVWNEQLADNIYRFMGQRVPDTMVVALEGNYGHASRWIENMRQGRAADINNGFLLDCLLANWDVTANIGNTALVGAETYRIDNGGALLFRAQGTRRTHFGGEVLELVTLRSFYPGLTSAEIEQQATELRHKLTDQAIDKLVDSVRLSLTDRDLLKARLKERRDSIIAAVIEGDKLLPTAEQLSCRQRFLNALESGELLKSPALSELVSEWDRLTGPNGYQHNGTLLGSHTTDVVYGIKTTPEWQQLDSREQALALIAAYFHDFEKPTGGVNKKVARDFDHGLKSSMTAARYLRNWGFSYREIETVCKSINNDGVVTDLLRGSKAPGVKEMTPAELAERLGDKRTTLILKALNRADAIAVVGHDTFGKIESNYEEFFAQVLGQL